LLSNRYKLITNVRSSLMAVNIHITIIELNALHTKRQNLFQELDAVIQDRKSGSAGMPRPISYAVFCLKKKKTKMKEKARHNTVHRCSSRSYAVRKLLSGGT